MQKFKISASKSGKKYNLILTAETEVEARERVHKEGYSILSIGLSDEKEVTGKKFIFHIISGKEIKRGIIVGEDIFKSYIKLRKDLRYDVKYLYPETDEGQLDDKKKARIIRDLEQGYKIKILSKENKKEIKQEDINETQKIDDTFYLKKQLEQTHELIKKVLEKFDPIVNQTKNYDLSPEKLEKLRTIYNHIKTFKKSNNIGKIKEIGELALLKIGEVELEILETEKSKDSKELLNETNNLLKQIGSGKQFREKSKDINYIISSFFEKIKENFIGNFNIKEVFKSKKKEELIDKESYSFLKTLLLLEKYTEKLKENNKDILKNIVAIIFPFGKNEEKKDKILIKRKVIQQNITILTAKKNGNIGSYTALTKGYNRIFEYIGQFFKSGRRVLLYVVICYSFIFVGYLSLVRIGYDFGNFAFNYKGILYFLIVLLGIMLGSFSRGVFMFFINFVFLVFIFIFSVVNF